MELFKKEEMEDNSVSTKSTEPLASRLRPIEFSDFIGQEDILKEGSFLDSFVKSGELSSIILWGPPGCGKTTLARLLAGKCEGNFVEFSAILSGVKEVREVLAQAKKDLRHNIKTLVFVDEIHRFNKSQQDAFLHHVEDGTITLIGATTENPSFEIISPLLSRCKVIPLNGIKKENIRELLERAVSDDVKGLGKYNIVQDDDYNEAMEIISDQSFGDGRFALNTLEGAFKIALIRDKEIIKITKEDIKNALQRKTLYDKKGEEHYNIVSGFIKSMRGSSPDAALYYMARMLDGGEDPLFILRRMVIFASEDIGNADPQALTVAVNAKEAFTFVGMPEGWIPMAQCCTYLAAAPKSNASYVAYANALKDVQEFGPLTVPMHIRNAPTNLMKDLGYGKNYKYPHNYEDGLTGDDYLPTELKGHKYYAPTDRGFDKVITDRLKEIEDKKQDTLRKGNEKCPKGLDGDK